MKGCTLCEEFERLIGRAIRQVRPEIEESWRGAYALHVGLDHMPRQRVSDESAVKR